MIRVSAGVVSALMLVSLAWWSYQQSTRLDSAPGWREVAPGIYRSPGMPAGYALVADDRALLIDAPAPTDGLKARGVKRIDRVLLTHHHRDSCAGAGSLLAEGVKVQAPKASASWLLPDEVKKYWRNALPLRNSRTAYLVVAEGLQGVDCSLTDGQAIEWEGWRIEVVSSPGHSADHVCFAVRKGKDGELSLCCGDVLASRGKMWSPYTTDWDHWTNAGLKPAAESLRRLAALNPARLLPAHGEVIDRDCKGALEATATAVEEVSFLKSFERYTKERLKNPPRYDFLAKEQAESNGSKPWTKVSQHLWLTGNTYVLVSKDNAFLVVDPWDPHSAKQIPRLKQDEKLGDLEVVLCSHAHYDHYDGIYTILDNHKPKFWTLDLVAAPLSEPFRWRAPFLDARPVRIDRRFKDGETATWREYQFKFHHFPGQSYYTTAVETTIDGKRCLFTADNFFHQDQFSGSGGWMGLNRSSPRMYAASAAKVLAVAPEWVLAEHGGAFVFDREDFRRREAWGKAAARAADALSPSGDHRRDWDPHRIHVEPVLNRAKAGDRVRAVLVVTNPLARAEKLTVRLRGSPATPDQSWEVEVGPGKTVRREVSLELAPRLGAGRHVLLVEARDGTNLDGADSFVVVEID